MPFSPAERQARHRQRLADRVSVLEARVLVLNEALTAAEAERDAAVAEAERLAVALSRKTGVSQRAL
jgi:hypothetical protein